MLFLICFKKTINIENCSVKSLIQSLKPFPGLGRRARWPTPSSRPCRPSRSCARSLTFRPAESRWWWTASPWYQDPWRPRRYRSRTWPLCSEKRIKNFRLINNIHKCTVIFKLFWGIVNLVIKFRGPRNFGFYCIL